MHNKLREKIRNVIISIDCTGTKRTPDYCISHQSCEKCKTDRIIKLVQEYTIERDMI